MRLGALLGIVAAGAGPRTLADRARELAGEGFDSLWAAQAVGRDFMVTDPLIALTVAAIAAEDIEIGTAVVQVPLYHPVDLAHRVLSLQQLCGERLILGVGAGSTAADYRAFGRDFEARFRVLRKSVAAMRGIFDTGVLGDTDLAPWPEVRGGPPVFLGSWGGAVERAARHYDGWIASAVNRDMSSMRESLARYRAAGGGRAIVSTILVSPNTDLGELGELLGGFADAGFDDAVVLPLPGAPPVGAIRKLVD